MGHAGLDQLHRMDAFQWLNAQLSVYVSDYLRALLGNDHGLVAHIQKAWPVVCARDGGTIDLHSHRNAQLSAVFYVLADPANDSGELEFEAPDDYFSHVMAIPYRDAAVSGGVFAPRPTGCCCSLRIFGIGCSLMKAKAPAIRSPMTWPSPRRQGRDARCEHPIPWIGFHSASRTRPERIPPARVHP